MKQIKLNRVFINAIIAAFLAVFVSSIAQLAAVDTALVGSVLFAASFIPRPSAKDLAFTGIYVDVWAKDIAQNLFPNNSFLSRAKNDNQYVDNDKVNKNESGTAPGSQRNRIVKPAPIVTRADVNLTYDINEYTTNPTLVSNIEEKELSYDKRMSVLEDHLNTLRAQMSDDALVAWAPTASARIVRTTGDNRTATAVSATGTRKKAKVEDIASLHQILDAEDAPDDGRVLILPATMYNDLVVDSRLASKDFGGPGLVRRALSEILGFEVFKRSRVLQFTNAGTPVVRTRLFDGSLSGSTTTDHLGALAYHPNFVCRAVGTIEPFANIKDATLFGSVFSALVRAGFGTEWTAKKGTAVLVEDTGA